MRYLLILLLLAAPVFAGQTTVVVEDTSAAAGAVAVDTPVFRGLLDAIVIDVAASSTQTVAIATADETILTLTGLTADGVYRPRLLTQDGVGADGAWSNSAPERVYISGEKLTVTVTATQVATNDVEVKVKFIDK